MMALLLFLGYRLYFYCVPLRDCDNLALRWLTSVALVLRNLSRHRYSYYPLLWPLYLYLPAVVLLLGRALTDLWIPGGSVAYRHLSMIFFC